jgi:transposase
LARTRPWLRSACNGFASAIRHWLADNLGSHKSTAVRQAIRDTGAKLLPLPKYSPDLNPIEQVFAKLKHRLREAQARTRESVSATIGAILDTYTAQECANYFRNSGYAQS